MKFWIENRISGIGHEFIGTFADAFESAKTLLFSDISYIAVYDENNKIIATLRWGGPNWISESYR